MSQKHRIGERELMDSLAINPTNRTRGHCPNTIELKRFAKGKYSKAPARGRELLEHLADCDLCNRTMAQIHARKRSVIRTTSGIAALVGVVALVIALAMWWRARQSAEQPNTIKLVDLRPLSPSRGPHRPLVSEPITILRSTSTLHILLPVGGEGSYEVAILSSRENRQVLLRIAGNARIENHQAVLNVPIQLSNFQSGEYRLALRHDDSDWEYYPFVLE